MYPYSMEICSYIIQPYDSYRQLAQKFNTSVEAIYAVNPQVDPYRLFVGQMICIPHGSQGTTPAYQMTRTAAAPTPCISKAEVELKNNMRMLWEQHVEWTRMTIMSIVFHLPDVDVVTARLLRNATDMGNSLRPFYGDQIAEKFSSLIKDHLVTAADLVKAILAGKQKLAAATEKKWVANADEIAEFLSGINPYLAKEEFRKMFYEHLALTKSEAGSMINKDYKSGIDAYDKIETQALEMSDAISDAIVRQFPGTII